MNKKDISRLLQRYLSGRQEGKHSYFDADEIDELLESFEESEDFTYYGEVVALGLRLHPGNLDLQIKQCRFYVYNEEYDSALALIESFADTDNEDIDLLRLECYAMNSYDQVTKYVEMLIKQECGYLERVFEYIASVLGDAGMEKEAYDFVNRGLALFPDNMALKDELCYSLEMRGEIPRAIEICNELIDKNPYSNDYWYTLGRLYSINGDYEKAIESFDFALTCDDSNEELKILKAYCLYMNENYDKAIEYYHEISTYDEIRHRVAPLLAECYVKLEEYEKGYELLKERLKQNNYPEDPDVYICYIRCCNETGRKEEASMALTKAAELYPENIRILFMLSTSYLENKDDHQAMEVAEHLLDLLEQAEEKDEEDFNHLYQGAHIFLMNGKIDKALHYYKKIFAFNPEMPHIHLHMAMAYLAKGDMKGFYEHYKQVSIEELIESLKNFKNGYGEETKLIHKHIAPEDLVKEFLNNKDNNN